MLSNFGPVDLLTITKILQTIQEFFWGHPGKYYFCKYGNPHLSNVLKMFESLMRLFLFFGGGGYLSFIIFREDEDREMLNSA